MSSHPITVPMQVKAQTNPYIIQPVQRMTLIKSNNWYYKPHSLPSSGVGGRCNRALLNYKKKRT